MSVIVILFSCSIYVTEIRRLLLPSLAEIFAVIVGVVLQHIVLFSYHKENHIYSVVHVAIAFSHLAKLEADRDRSFNFGGEFAVAIFGQFCGLLLCQLLSNHGFFGWICREICKAFDWNFSPIPLKLIEVLLTLLPYLQ